MLRRLRNLIAPDLALDLGTANTLIALRGRGVVLNEPSVVALHKGTRRILGRGAAVGKLARQMLGRAPDSIQTLCPLHHGVISDYELCEVMLRYFFQKVSATSWTIRPRVLIAVPGGITPVERRAVFNSLERAGAGRIYLISQSKAAAIGAGLPISEPMANMICDIGMGTTEIAVLSMAEMVASNSLQTAGAAFARAVADHLRQRFSMRIGLQTAERLIIDIGSAYPLEQELTCEVSGLDTVSSVPRKTVLTSEEIRLALQAPLTIVLNGIKQAIEACQPELVSDLAETGLVLSGGGALLRGIELLFTEQLGIPVRTASDPVETVVRGCMICVEHLDQWRDSLDNGLSAA
jgi:rod shape-determining protein MreB and related proteins